MEGRERTVTMSPATPSPPSEFLREKRRGSREQPSMGLRLCKEMWAIEREEREGLEERQLCQQQGRASDDAQGWI